MFRNLNLQQAKGIKKRRACFVLCINFNYVVTLPIDWLFFFDFLVFFEIIYFVTWCN